MKAQAYVGRSRTVNYPLSIGMALSVMVLAVAVFGPMLAPHDPLKEYGVILIDGRPYGPPPLERPIPPFLDARFPLGTDGTMRDVLSRLLWAVRPTLIMCVVIMLVRLGIGVVLGGLAGWFRGVERVVDAATAVCTAVPLLAVAVAILLGWGLQRGLVGFVVALSLTGWCDTASVVKTRVQAIRRAPYVESAHAIGLRTGGILRRHVLPQLRPFLPLLVAFELSAVLLVVAELGYLGYYLSGGAVFEYSIGNSDRNFTLRPGTPELGQMLSNFFRNLYRTPWIAIAAGGTVFTMLAAFALVGEGLRRRLDITRARRARLRLPEPLLDALALPRWRWGLAGVATGAVLLLGVVSVRQWTQASAVEGAVAASVAESASAAPVFGTTPMAAEQLASIDLDALIRQPGIVPDNYDVFQVTDRVRDQFRDVPKPTKAASIGLKRQGVIAGRVQVLLYADVAQRDAAMQTIADVVSGRTRYPDFIVAPPSDPVPVAGERSISFQIMRASVIYFLSPDPQVLFVRCGAAVWLQLGESSQPALNEGNHGASAEMVAMAEVVAMAQALDQQLAPQVCLP